MPDELSRETLDLAAQFTIQASACDGTILHGKHASKTPSIPTYRYWSALPQVQLGQLRHPLERGS